MESGGNDAELETLSDEELVGLAKLGHQHVIEFLLNKYKPLVRVVTRSYFLVGSDREDILQEGMIGLYKSILYYDADKVSSYKYFAEMCVKRQVITAIKHATRQKNIPLNTYISLSQTPSDEDTDKEFMEILDYSRIMDPEDILISQERLNDIEMQIKNILSDYEMEVLKLYLSGVSYQEVAENMNKDYKSIDNALQRVKKKLEDIIPNK